MYVIFFSYPNVNSCKARTSFYLLVHIISFNFELINKELSDLRWSENQFDVLVTTVLSNLF